MKKYIQSSGYRYIKNYDDVNHKEFALVSSTMSDSSFSTFGNTKLDRVEVYELFLKDVDLAVLQGQVMDMVNTAISEGVNVSVGSAVEVENVENGFNITLAFTIRG